MNPGKKMMTMNIFKAIEQGRTEVVVEYIGQGGDLNATDGSKDTLIEAAAAYGRLEIVRILLAAGADPDHYGSWESGSALALALENGHRDICKILVAGGANVNINLEDGMTLLMCSVNSLDEDCELMKALLEAGADPNARCDGDTALSFAVYRGHRNICCQLAPLMEAEDRRFLLEWIEAQPGERYLLAHQQSEIREILLRAG